MLKHLCDSGSVGRALASQAEGRGFESPSIALNLCIVQHMGKYFAQEIFEAIYGDIVDYTWL